MNHRQWHIWMHLGRGSRPRIGRRYLIRILECDGGEIEKVLEDKPFVELERELCCTL